MILIEKINTFDVEAQESSKPRYTDEQLRQFNEYIYHEIEDALSQRKQLEFSWIQSMRDYEARPRAEVVNIPIEDCPNIVVPLCALAAESVYSIAIDLIFGTSPVLTIRSQDTNAAKALQILVNKLAASPDVNFRASVEHALLDDVNLGTGCFYVPWTEATKKTDINRIKYFGPRIYAIPPEDIIAPGGSYVDIELLPWIAFRTYPTVFELKARAKKLSLDIEGVVAAGTVDQVRQTRESLARSSQSGVRMQKIYEVFDFYCTYDIDDDGELEDMLVFFDRTSRKIMKIQFNPYERRPFRKMAYQIRAHQFYGMGVAEMLRYLQEEISTLHNHKTLNLILANTRMWKSKHGTFPTGNVRVWPNRNVEVSDPNDFAEMKLSDVYPSELTAEASDLQLAERRVGSELPMPKPSQLMSSRTPATTTMSMLQQINRRFTPAFDQMRQACSGSVKDCLFRIQEQLLAGNVDVQAWILKLVGQQLGAKAVAVLADPTFDDEVLIELTASSVTVNREVEKNEMLQLVDRLSMYYEKILQLAAVATNPMTPPPVAMVARQIAEKSAEVLDRVLRTFDSVRDPQDLIVHIEQQIDQALPGQQVQQAMPMLQALLGGGAQQPGAPGAQNGGGGVPPEGAPPQ